jgi:hypothetical protein
MQSVPILYQLQHSRHPLLVIYGPIIYMALYVMILMRATPLRGLEGGGLGPGN